MDREDIGQVSTITTIVPQVGAAFGVALIGTVVTIRSAFHEEAVSGFQDGFLYIGIFSFLAVIPAIDLLGMQSFTRTRKSP